MTTSEKTVYKCDFCGKNYLRKHAAETHERYCGKNPLNQHVCYSCVFLSVGREKVEEGFSEKTFTCTKLDKQMHGVKAERIGHSCLGYTERMPVQCPDYE